MSAESERLPSLRTSQLTSHERKLGLAGLFRAKERDWGVSLYNFGHRSGHEELRQMTDSVIRNDTQYMIRIVEQQAANRQKVEPDTLYEEHGTTYRRITFRDNLEGMSRAREVGEGLNVTTISFYRDYELDKNGQMITPSVSSLCGINFDVTVGEQAVSYVIGHRSDNTSFVKTAPGGIVYPDIFPIAGSRIPNKLAELYPEQSPTAKADMVRDMSSRSVRELELTLGARKIVEQIYGVSMLEIRTATMTDIFIHVIDELPDITIILEKWRENLQLAKDGKI
jgi:hypothetical protein